MWWVNVDGPRHHVGAHANLLISQRVRDGVGPARTAGGGAALGGARGRGGEHVVQVSEGTAAEAHAALAAERGGQLSQSSAHLLVLLAAPFVVAGAAAAVAAAAAAAAAEATAAAAVVDAAVTSSSTAFFNVALALSLVVPGGRLAEVNTLRRSVLNV